jgi:nucleoside-diphosphate-sugar epimerase
MRVLITGAMGFIGRHVLNQIINGEHDVLALGLEKIVDEDTDRSVRWLYGNIKETESLGPAIRSFDPEAVVHLAWQGIPDYSEVISRTNLNDSIQLLDFIIEETNCKKIIVSGSCFEYGKSQGVCVESDSIQLTSFFSWAKYSLYQYLQLKCNQKEVELIWFRIFYAYGPYQRDGALIPALVKALKDGKGLEIRSPLNKSDFIYIEDIAEAFRAALDMKVESGVYNLGYGISRSVYDVCRIGEKHFPESLRISDYVLQHGSKEKVCDFSADMNKTVKSFNWRPRITLEEGILKYIEFQKRKE